MKHGMSIIVKQVADLVIGFILMYSIYIILYGHLSPGGGFAGGVILACGFVLLVLAHGKEFVNGLVSDNTLKYGDCVGALAFLAVALIGYVMADQFFTNVLSRPGDFRLVSSGIIPLANIAIGVKVAACMAGAFAVLIVFRDQPS